MRVLRREGEAALCAVHARFGASESAGRAMILLDHLTKSNKHASINMAQDMQCSLELHLDLD